MEEISDMNEIVDRLQQLNYQGKQLIGQLQSNLAEDGNQENGNPNEATSITLKLLCQINFEIQRFREETNRRFDDVENRLERLEQRNVMTNELVQRPEPTNDHPVIHNVPESIASRSTSFIENNDWSLAALVGSEPVVINEKDLIGAVGDRREGGEDDAVLHNEEHFLGIVGGEAASDIDSHQNIVITPHESEIRSISTDRVVSRLGNMVTLDDDTDETSRYDEWIPVGRGAYGEVYKVTDRCDGGTRGVINRTVALKAINLSKFPKGKKSQTIHELAIMKKLNHPNIVRYFDAFFERDNAEGRNCGYLWISMEFMDGGDLQRLVKNTSTVDMTESIIGLIAHEILTGVDFLHRNRIIHRDLKSSNILLGQNGDVKITDFGLSVQLSEEESRKTIIGTPYYIAPEIVQKNYDMKADVWSIGVIMFEMINGNVPYSNVRDSIVAPRLLKQRGKPRTRQISSELNDIVDQCFIVDPTERPDASTLLRHSFVQKYKNHSKESLFTLIKNSIERR